MLTSAAAQPSASVTVLPDDSLVSVPLNRAVHLTIILPPAYSETGPKLPVLYLNDGQDLPRLHMSDVLDSLYNAQAIRPFVLVAMHANVDRIQEYGTAAQPDYMKRGSKASAYTDFVLTELLPYIQSHYHVSADPAQCAIAGFSLGGLSAFDIGFHHPDRFSRIGVFSGSFWWRKKQFSSAYDDETDRIMHSLIRESHRKPAVRFWLQTGTNDETSDRNNNGVIDSIDDTLDIIRELEKKGYQREHNGASGDIRYVEVQGGEHNQTTWSAVMPDFLGWAFGK
ncbi:alpha/beta hydrolase [Fibrivirga algicola]|uniref:Esterase family protein n=1 Tax=Fibrivirga algicola TaxID=2950420 RepID=A0ABX0QGI6_9BACT|nr:alpha/beta hydrolase-fold protein [Fibrivirga algicola]NID11172.1 esterase family protein [Fibrivirga algicola]